MELVVSLCFPVQGHNVLHVITEENEDSVVSWNDDPMLSIYSIGGEVVSPQKLYASFSTRTSIHGEWRGLFLPLYQGMYCLLLMWRHHM